MAKAGITIPETSATNDDLRMKRDVLEVLIKVAARFFYDNLKTQDSVLEYLRRRGIQSNTIVKFGLGYSKDSWDSL